MFQRKPICAGLSGSCILFLLCCPIALTQQPLPPDDSTKQSAEKSQTLTSKPDTQTAETTSKPTFNLKVRAKPILNVTLKAEKAKLTEVAESLSKQLKTKVFVSPALQKHLISLEFFELTLEPAMQLLAPQVYIDYEINTGSPAPAKPIGIFLLPAGQGEPPLSPEALGNTQSLLVEGNTEENSEPATDEEKRRVEEQPLRVHFQNNILSIKAKKQPLSLVLLKIGEELGIPVDIESQTTDIVDTEIKKLPVEDALRRLSPNIVLFLRADLFHGERRALRLVLPDFRNPKSRGF